MKNKLFLLAAVVSLHAATFIKTDDSQKNSAKDFLSQALKPQAPTGIDKQVDEWIAQQIEQKAIPAQELILLINCIYNSHNFSASYVKTYTLLNQLTLLSIAINLDINDGADTTGYIDQARQILDQFKHTAKQFAYESALMKQTHDHAAQHTDGPCLAAFEVLQQVIIKNELALCVKKQKADLSKALEQSSEILNGAGENFKKMAAYCASLSKGDIPSETPINDEDKDLVTMNFSSEIAHAATDNSFEVVGSVMPILNQGILLHYVSKTVFAALYTKLYQYLLKKNVKPLICFTTQSYLNEKQQKDLLPPVLK